MAAGSESEDHGSQPWLPDQSPRVTVSLPIRAVIAIAAEPPTTTLATARRGAAPPALAPAHPRAARASTDIETTATASIELGAATMAASGTAAPCHHRCVPAGRGRRHSEHQTGGRDDAVIGAQHGRPETTETPGLVLLPVARWRRASIGFAQRPPPGTLVIGRRCIPMGWEPTESRTQAGRMGGGRNTGTCFPAPCYSP